MRKQLKYWLHVLAIVAIIVSVAHAQEKVEETKTFETVVPAAQTADWTREWWGPRHNQKVARIQQGNVELLMIGDSITHLWEYDGREVWSKYYKHRKAVNLGFIGDRTEHVIWRLQNGEVDGISPELAVLMIGTNNTGQRRDSAKLTAAGIKAIIKELQTRLPETKILLLAIFPRGEKPEDLFRKLNDHINTIISGYADNQNVFFLNINNRFLDEKGNLSKTIMPDLLHPNSKGYQIWAEAMEPMINKLMDKK
jgi:beta-glucosidase